MSRIFRFFASFSLLLSIVGCGSAGSNSSSGHQMGGSIQVDSTSPKGVVNTLTSTGFDTPFGITTDSNNLYVADYKHSFIKKISITTGAVTTFSGADLRFVAPTGITTDGTNIYVLDTGSHSILRIVIATGDVTPLVNVSSGLSLAYGITTDGTNLYVADTDNNVIRKIAIATRDVTTLAGTEGVSGSSDGAGTAATFNSPYGITTDGTNLYVADTGNSVIRKIVIATGAVTTLAGTPGVPGNNDGIGPGAGFNRPIGITTDGTNLYVADTDNHTIRKIVIATGSVYALAGTSGIPGLKDGTGSAVTFDSPYGITTNGVSLFVADSGNNTIRGIR